MVKVYQTSFIAIMPETFEQVSVLGIRVAAKSFPEAEKWCKQNAPYLSVLCEVNLREDEDTRHTLDTAEEPKESKPTESKPSK